MILFAVIHPRNDGDFLLVFFNETEFPRLKELHGIKYLVCGMTKNFNYVTKVSSFNLEAR